jgi:hypothetical protein
MSKQVALRIVREQPETFGVRSWDAMRLMGCLPWVAILLLAWWINLSWWGWILAVLFAGVISSSATNAMGQTALNEVVAMALKDAEFYEWLITQNLLDVVKR